MMSEIKIDGNIISTSAPTYFIADIAANHDGDLERAKELIYRCADAGANAAKFQHFTAKTIVSDYGFNALPGKQSHQASWKKSVYEVYEDASLNHDWTPILKETCDDAGVTFFTSPYSLELVDKVDSFVPAYKVGSGDISWHEIIDYMASKGKPVLLACGASSFDDICFAMETVLKHTNDVVLMQCNTNYTASSENFKFINLNVLNTFRDMFPDVILGLSDHTPGHATVLGAVALGARVIEKHFTDDNNRDGPDHKFSMSPIAWREMVDRTRELEMSLGSGVKKVEQNEQETVILQRRAIRAKNNLDVGTVLTREHVEALRPCPINALAPYEIEKILGKSVRQNIPSGECIYWNDLN